jgi:hypothetical protein
MRARAHLGRRIQSRWSQALELALSVAALLVVLPGLRVVFMSGHRENVELEGELANDQVSILPKPFLPDALVRRVHEALAPSYAAGSSHSKNLPKP